MMNMHLGLVVSLLCAIATLPTAIALSCACFTYNPSFTNDLYTKNIAVRVKVGEQIIKPKPEPLPYEEEKDGEVLIMEPYFPTSWLPQYFEARVVEVFKQEFPGTNEEDGGVAQQIEANRDSVLKKGDNIVVRGGGCSYTPTPNTEYILFTNHVNENVDVPGKGPADVVDMPGYCEYMSTWDDLEDYRIRQLKLYKRKGQTKCFEEDCAFESIAFAVPSLMCGDGKTSVSGSLVCEWNEKMGQCQKDMKMDECPEVKKRLRH